MVEKKHFKSKIRELLSMANLADNAEKTSSGSDELVYPTRLARRAVTRVRWRERLIGTAALFLPVRDNPSSPHAWKNGSTILLYHRIIDDSETTPDAFAVQRKMFESQVEWLSRTYTLLTASELSRRILKSEPITNTAVITFDDSYDSTFIHAWPILRSYGIPATVFIDTGRLDGSPPALSHDQVSAMAVEGIEIGSHTISHTDMRTLSDAELFHELKQSREILSDITGLPIYGFAYPFGRYEKHVVQCVRQAGYVYACTCRQHQSNHTGNDPYLLNRVEINQYDRLRRFQRKVTGYYASVYATWYRINPATRSWLVG